jgi:hypothetical protein
MDVPTPTRLSENRETRGAIRSAALALFMAQYVLIKKTKTGT